MGGNQATPPDPKHEDAHLEALTNALISSFLGSVAGESEMSDAAKALEYTLNTFITGPHPPFKGWFINELAYYPWVRMRVTILTHQDIEHKIVLQVDAASMMRQSEENGDSDEDTPHLS